jgi:hypothetical protein
MPVKVRCPNPACRHSATVAEEHRDRVHRCPHCGEKFTPFTQLDAGRDNTRRDESLPARLNAMPVVARRAGIPQQVGRFAIRDGAEKVSGGGKGVRNRFAIVIMTCLVVVHN